MPSNHNADSMPIHSRNPSQFHLTLILYFFKLDSTHILNKYRLIVEVELSGWVSLSLLQVSTTASLLIRANMVTDLPDGQKLTDTNVLARMS